MGIRTKRPPTQGVDAGTALPETYGASFETPAIGVRRHRRLTTFLAYTFNSATDVRLKMQAKDANGNWFDVSKVADDLTAETAEVVFDDGASFNRAVTWDVTPYTEVKFLGIRTAGAVSDVAGLSYAASE